MTTDPGDLILDPTCGSGTTAFVAEQWGRRWITIDTSRVALALARGRIMGSPIPLLPALRQRRGGSEGEAKITRTEPPSGPHYGDIRQGFVYERVPHITLGAISRTTPRFDVIWEQFQDTLEPLREQLNAELGESWEEWEIPREAEERVAGRGAGAARAVVGAAYVQAPARDRRLDRREGGLRVPLRQAVHRQPQGACRRAVHGREPLAAPRPRRRRGRRTDRRRRRDLQGRTASRGTSARRSWSI